MYYAQLDENNICIGVSQLSGEVNAPNIILLESYDDSLLGKKYKNGTWEIITIPPSPEDILSATNTAKLNEILLLLKGVI